MTLYHYYLGVRKLKIIVSLIKNLNHKFNGLKHMTQKFLTLKEFIKYKEKGKFPKRSVWINF